MLFDSSYTPHLQLYWNSTLNACQTWSTLLKVYLIDVLEHLIIFLLSYIVASLVLYLFIVKWKKIKFQRDVRRAPKRVLLVIAHPDDETMFFGPTVLRFTKDPQCSVYLLCLSTGWNYGMDKVRKDELYKACRVLGIKSECIWVQKHTKLPDNMKTRWPAEIIASIVSNHVEALDIDTLITFDRHGVSRHVNHCSIYYAVALLSMENKLPKSCNIYVLETINLLRKYWMFFDLPICYILSRIRYISNTNDRRVLYKAMEMHKSQLVWFRKLYMRFSRYQLINTLQRMDLSDIELDLKVDD